MHAKLIMVGAAGVLLLAAGCAESPHPVVLHKPGVYKGQPDPLVEKQRDPKQQELLLARFKQVQTDR